MKLGKKSPKIDRRTLQLANYLDTAQIPTIPTQFDWSGKVPSWPMYSNDQIGDCTIASVGHQIMAWTANASAEITPSDHDIITAYSAVSGYDPQTGEGDNGAVELDVLNYWRRNGIAGHKIYAYASLQLRNHSHIKAACYLFGGVYIGLMLPLTARDQAIWTVPNGGLHGNGRPGSWGGHAVPVLAWDAYYLTCVTWGRLQRMTWDFWSKYCDEAYAVLSQDFIDSKGIAPNAVNWNALQQDLKNIH